MAITDPYADAEQYRAWISPDRDGDGDELIVEDGADVVAEAEAVAERAP